MAITIRNRETEDMIRELGRRNREGPSAVVRRLAERALLQEGLAREDEKLREDRLALDRWEESRSAAKPKVSFAQIMSDIDDVQSDLHD